MLKASEDKGETKVTDLIEKIMLNIWTNLEGE
jgi:hypothetical protein